MRSFWFGARLTYHARGNTQVAQTKEREVRIAAALLFSALIPQQNYGIGKWRLPDGSRMQVQVMRDPHGERVFARVWSPVTRAVEDADYYLESGFLVPSIETYTWFTTSDGLSARDISPEALWIHNDRVESWSNRSAEEIGFTAQPLGTALVARTRPLCLGFDEPREELSYYLASRRWHKTWQHFHGYELWQQNVMEGRGPGTSTGKMVLYQRAKLGRKVELWQDASGLYDDYVINTQSATHDCTGLLTDAYGDYWKVKIEDSATATFTKLSVPDVLRTALNNATTPQERLFIEAFALGYSTPMDGQGDRPTLVYTVAIGNAPTLTEGAYGQWKPVAYSWHFNWRGNKAVMVAHRGVNSYEVSTSRIDNVQTEIWELDLSVTHHSDGTYSPSVSFAKLGARSEWSRITEVSSDIVYVPSLLAGSAKIQTVWSAPGAGVSGTYSPPNEVPIYAWYGADSASDPANDAIYRVDYSRTRTVLSETFTGNYTVAAIFVVYGASVVLANGQRFAGVSQTISYSVSKGGALLKRVSAFSSGHVDTKSVTMDEGESYTVYAPIGGSGISYTDNSSGSPVTYTAIPIPSENSVGADRTVHFWQPTVDYTNVTNSGTPPSITLTIPHDCAEGAMVAKNYTYQRSTTHRVYVDSPTPSIKYEAISNVRSLPSGTSAGPSANTGRGQADFSVPVNTAVSDYVYDLECYAVGRNSATAYTEAATGVSATVPAVDNFFGCPESVIYAGYNELEPIREPMSMFEAFGGELMIRAHEDHFINDFPAGFASVLYPPVIVGSI